MVLLVLFRKSRANKNASIEITKPWLKLER